MGKIAAFRRVHPDKEIAFERGRLLNLIDSKIRRKEMDAAKGFAEELFRIEIEFALRKKARMLSKYKNLLLRIIVALVSVLFICTAFMVLNIRPAFSLVIETFTVLGIISAVMIYAFLGKRFGKALRVLIEAYETQKQFFIERVLTHLMKCGSPEDWQRLCTITAIE